MGAAETVAETKKFFSITISGTIIVGEWDMSKLWQKNYTLDELIEEFTVGEDWKLDRELVISDSLASIAHARGLEKIGILSTQERDALESVLKEIMQEAGEGAFTIEPSDEDGHTAIENVLVQHTGEAGKKIHTGRSRNDQVLAALRLYGRDASFRILEAGLDLVKSLIRCAGENKKVPMVGRTHMQIAMPSSAGLWASSFAEELADDLSHLFRTARHIDQCPLGSAASYGVPLPLDREYVSSLLGFRSLQRNVLYANNARGKFESLLLDAGDQLLLTLSKMAQDLILFSLPEFGYVSLPDELCSGSSIMPQKKNPDALELIRGKSATLSAYAQNVKMVIRSLPSGYNRDFQETKEPFLRGLRIVHRSLLVMRRTVDSMKFNKETMRDAFSGEVFATDAAIERVGEGESFREAYRFVGTHLDELEKRRPDESIANRTSAGTAGNLGLEELSQRVEGLQRSAQEAEEKSRVSLEALAEGSPRPTALWDGRPRG
ncbi:MAG: argininosuccinate lyase [Spirochaetia bacterium]